MWTNYKAYYELLAKQVEPCTILTTKDGWFWKVLATLIAILTFGKCSRRLFLEDMATTIGPVQAYPRAWPNLSTSIIWHESRHARQARWFGFGISPWLGLPLMAVVYLLLPIPIYFAAGRFLLEADAETYVWEMARKLRPGVKLSFNSRALDFADNLSSATYAWAWPRRWARKYLIRKDKSL